jgi:hypothetical protein
MPINEAAVECYTAVILILDRRPVEQFEHLGVRKLHRRWPDKQFATHRYGPARGGRVTLL